jgi:hypothetical protein
VQSVSKTQPIETEEISLIDKFILAHSSQYKLPGPVYKNLLVKIIENRIDNKDWLDNASN